MKAIVELNNAEYNRLCDVSRNLRSATAGLSWTDMIDNYQQSRGYAHYTFRGKVKQALIDRLGRMPTGDEIIILVDGGFSHFGASCSISPDGHFSGRVNTD